MNGDEFFDNFVDFWVVVAVVAEGGFSAPVVSGYYFSFFIFAHVLSNNCQEWK